MDEIVGLEAVGAPIDEADDLADRDEIVLGIFTGRNVVVNAAVLIEDCRQTLMNSGDLINNFLMDQPEGGMFGTPFPVTAISLMNLGKKRIEGCTGIADCSRNEGDRLTKVAGSQKEEITINVGLVRPEDFLDGIDI